MPVRVVIDGREVVLEKPTTILNAARSAGIDIPSLCYDERLEPYGACRLCLVEVKGRGLVTSCTTKVEDGMEVLTETEQVREARREILKMIAKRYPPTSAPNRVLELMKRYGVEPSGAENPRLVDERHPWIRVDLGRCVLCFNCVRACEGYIGRLIWRTLYRGAQTIVMPETGSLATSSCISCRACVDVCPSGAIVDKVMASARPASYGETACAMCSVSCPLRVGYSDGSPAYVEGLTGELGFAAAGCLKGRYHWEDLVYSPERPSSSLARRGARLSPVSSEEALDLVAGELRKAAAESPRSVGIIIASRLPMEAYYLAQLVARAGLGTNNVDVAASLAPATSEAIELSGSPLSTMALSDIYKSRTIVVVGGGLEDNHGALGYAARVQSLRGRARLVLVAPEGDKLSSAADVHLETGDLAGALRAVESALVDLGLARAEGPAAARAFRLRGRHRELAKSLGLEPRDVEEAARLVADGPAAFLLELGCSAEGAYREAYGLAELSGNLGREGAGVVPLLSAYDNAEGVLAGASPDRLPGMAGLGERGRFESAWRARVPEEPGMSAAEMLEAAAEGRMRALLVVGELASPSELRDEILAALYKVPFVATAGPVAGTTAQSASKVHLLTASHVEEEGVYMAVDGTLRLARGTRARGGAMRAWEVMASLLSRLGHWRRYSSAAEAWDEMRSLVPWLSAATYERLSAGPLRASPRP